ncbi:MAG: helix-turn-helix transcriptional regulator [Oscillospiraceae bacterium]|jgi:transcriptional regulator with XRE-family HTH domain|nr:helix-turn-helix transcriptional regulator [Oscillospiraceae bacterium]
MESALHLGKQLQTLRIKNGYTQREIGRLLGIDRSTYAYYETNRTTPPLSTLKKLAAIFNVTVNSLLDNEANQPIVCDPDSLSFTDFDHNLSHVYDLQPEERQLVALFRLADKNSQKDFLSLLFQYVHKQKSKHPEC